MARNTRSARLENRTNRLKLPVAKKPVFVKIDRGVALGYRRNRGPGTWVMRVTRDGEDWTKAIGPADDYEEAAAGRTLTYWAAQARARELALGGRTRRASRATPASLPPSLRRLTLTRPTSRRVAPTLTTHAGVGSICPRA